MKSRSQRSVISTGSLVLLLVLMAVALGTTGCGSLADEPENKDSKPWNSPEGYQNGNLPSNLFH